MEIQRRKEHATPLVSAKSGAGNRISCKKKMLELELGEHATLLFNFMFLFDESKQVAATK
jgi:hypothetical protein